MKICMISGLAKFSGGLETFDELSSCLINRGVAVDVFGRSSYDFVESANNYRTIGFRPYFLFPHVKGLPDYGKFEYNLKVYRKIKTFGPYDLIHGHGDNCFFFLSI